MKPLVVLLVAFFVAALVLRLWRGQNRFALAGRIAMAVMLVFTAIGHFAFTEGMVMMLPDVVPYKEAVVYATGVLEVLAAIGLLVPATRVVTGWLLILFFLLILPANIHAAIRGVDYQQASLGGPGLEYLWFRVPLQLLFIAWTYFSAVRR